MSFVIAAESGDIPINLGGDKNTLKRTMTDRITRLLVEVGNDGPIKRSMDQIVVVLLKDLTALKPVFLSSLIACVKEIPIKTTVYGCLTGILNLRDSAFVQLIVDHACDALDDAIKSGDFKSAKLMMRYIGELVNAGVISAQSYLHLIETLLAVLQSSTVRPQLLDAIVSVVLGSLPWSSYCLSQNDREGLNKVVAIVEVYMNRRRNSLRFGSLGHVFDALKVYRDCPETEPYVQVD
ncbi:Nuclear cap-binding protein subunit 1, partial [Entophlyctis luteolus]